MLKLGERNQIQLRRTSPLAVAGDPAATTPLPITLDRPRPHRRGFFFDGRRYILDRAPTVEVEAPTMRAILLALVLMLSVAACHDPNSHPYDYMPEGSSGGGGNR